MTAPSLSKLIRYCERQKSMKRRQIKGGLVTCCTTEAERANDREEVRAYLRANPTARIWEVAMCCNMSDGAAARLMKEARG